MFSVYQRISKESRTGVGCIQNYKNEILGQKMSYRYNTDNN